METLLQDLQFEMFIPEEVLYTKWHLRPTVFDLVKVGGKYALR